VFAAEPSLQESVEVGDFFSPTYSFHSQKKQYQGMEAAPASATSSWLS
jgi:hypothetical protein